MDFQNINEQLLNANRIMDKNNVTGTITMFGSARISEDSEEYKMARKVSKAVSEAFPQYHLCTGGGPSIMKACNSGAREANIKSIGMGISLPFEQSMNQFVDIEIPFEHFFLRKYWMLHNAKAVLFFIGGLGTLDELFTTLVLIQCEKIEKLPVVLIGGEFWKNAINMDFLKKRGLINQADNQFIISDDIDDIVDYLKKNIVD